MEKQKQDMIKVLQKLGQDQYEGTDPVEDAKDLRKKKIKQIKNA